MDLPVPRLEFVTELTVELGSLRVLGQGRAGERRIIPIIGGTMIGPRLNGRVLNVGADWQSVFADGLAELDTRYALETDDGATLEILNYGFRHGPDDVIDALARGEEVAPDRYYMRTHARLETGDQRYLWVNRALFVGVGARRAQSVVMRLYSIA